MDYHTHLALTMNWHTKTTISDYYICKRNCSFLTTVAPQDPQCNGFTENLTKLVCKIIHASCSENKNLKNRTVQPYICQQNNHLLRCCLIDWWILSYLKRHHMLTHYKTKKPDSCAIAKNSSSSKLHIVSSKDISIQDHILKQTKSTTKPPFNP